jgi:RNA polymerase sigma factor (sigma-70 family)
MPKERFDNLVHRLRIILTFHNQDVRSDAELLDKYFEDRDEVAFTALVARHGQAVWEVCIRLMRSLQDAEDVFQATFLQLARKAGRVRQGGASVRGWLCRVATHTASNARRTNARKASLNQRFSELPTERDEKPDRSEVWDMIVEELSNLPTQYREALEKCLLLGQTCREAAVQLGCSHSAVQRRIERAQEILRERLEKRGVVVASGSALFAAFGANLSTANAAPIGLFARVIESAAAGGGAEPVKAPVAALAKSVGLTGKSKSWLVAAALMVGVGVAGSALWAARPGAPTPEAPRTTAQPDQADAAADANRPAQDGQGEVTVTGQVLDADGKTVPRASVVVFGRRAFRRGEFNIHDDALGQTRAGEDGRFSVTVRQPAEDRLPNGLVRVWAAAPGHAPAGVTLTSGGDARASEIRLLRADVIRGAVLDLDGAPVVGAPVSVYQVGQVSLEPVEGEREAEAPPFWPEPVTTGEDGTFEIQGLNLKQGVRLRVSDDRYALKRIALTEAGWAGRSGAIALAPLQYLEGRVIAADTKKALPRPRLSICVLDGKGAQVGASIDISGDVSGAFRVRLLPGQSYAILAYAPDDAPYLPIRKRLEWPEGETGQRLEIELPRGVMIEGKVTDRSTDRPLPAIRARFVPFPGECAKLGPILVGACGMSCSGGDGHFRLVTPNCPGKLIFSDPSGERVADGVVLACEGGLATGRTIDIALRAGVKIEGQVLDPDGKPVERGTVLFQNLPSRLACAPTPTTFRDGRFELRGCEAGRLYTVLFLDARHKFGARVDLRADGQAATVKLERCGQVAVRMINERFEAWNKSPVLAVVVPPRPASKGEPEEAPPGDVLYAMSRFDPLHYGRTTTLAHDKQGKMILPALIPGVRYRLANVRARTGNGELKPIYWEVGPGQSLTKYLMIRETQPAADADED